jgi:hypothetical protein
MKEMDKANCWEEYLRLKVELLKVQGFSGLSIIHTLRKECDEWQKSLPLWEGHKDMSSAVELVTAYDNIIWKLTKEWFQ